jgi:hypothetical protein
VASPDMWLPCRCETRYTHGAEPFHPRSLREVVSDWPHVPRVGVPISQGGPNPDVYVIKVERRGPRAARITLGTKEQLEGGAWTASPWPRSFSLFEPAGGFIPEPLGPDDFSEGPLPPLGAVQASFW